MKIGLSTEVEAMLIFEQDGDLAAVEHDVNEMTRIANENGAIFTKIANDEAEADKLKTARRVALSALSRLRPTTILEDATVPRSEIAKMVNKIDEIAKNITFRLLLLVMRGWEFASYMCNRCS